MSDENYHDIDGKPCSLEKLCRTSPEWAANRIRALITQVSKAEDRVAELEDALQECQRLADSSVDDHEPNQHLWLSSVSKACNAALTEGKGDESS